MELNYGKILHEVISAYYKLCSSQIGKRDIYAVFKDKWENEQYKYGNKSEDYYNKCLTAIDMFMECKISRIIPLASEYRFDSVLNKKLRLVGRIDFIGKENNDIQIWDFKLDESEIVSKKEQHKKYFQLLFYYYGIGEKFGSFARQVGYYILTKGKIVSIDISPELLKNGFQEILDTINKMKEEKEYKPKNNEYCSSCGYKYICSQTKRGE
jgi:CRISPR/Cas system-associated exonuclease Cas4 (RecB family)